MKAILSLLTILISLNSFAIEQHFCDQSLESLPIRQDGRVKPLKVHASEMLKYLTGKTKYEGLSSTITFCLVSLKGMGIPTEVDLKTNIEHVDLIKTLELKDGEHRVSFEKLEEEMAIIRSEWQKAKEHSSYKKSLSSVLNKINLYKDIKTANNWLVPLVNSKDDVAWLPVGAYLTEEKVLAAKETSDRPFLKVLKDSEEQYEKIVDKDFLIELTYVNMQLPVVALILTFCGLITMTLFRKFHIALVFAVLTVVVQTAILAFRVHISGRAPITNMYETVLFSGYGALILALVIGHFKKEKIYVFVGLAYNVCTLLMLNFAGGMLSSSISPLVPVLRDNFWLSTHVTTIILSYGALALSWVLSNTVLIRKKFFFMSPADERYYSELVYTCLKYGTIMLAAGIILGGVWADYSWGRFWGWDPKETWSLIVLCLYMAILHGKYTNWIPHNRFFLLVAAAFMSVMMAWFGVNYILATGLHSYGFSEGGAIFLGSFFAVQTLVLLLTFSNFNIKKEDGPNA
ncbi:putative membrane protein [Halobacteriovorax marinus SJ]|uniref:Membrane protein n=1 Tax=Halobacteriovorax marinus (strain ATCC BAA-682 / DSM 15412 / SJ) TaxID=862908 RepID=E1X357_HALMS|nr:cytochrome c biogenesis protein CcsA [Halobacteriovorax marinus]CBW26887.1 putative membrane protein [Halobacteriovorax marinus SJ]